MHCTGTGKLTLSRSQALPILQSCRRGGDRPGLVGLGTQVLSPGREIRCGRMLKGYWQVKAIIHV